ncbi:MAG: glycosyltransferase family 4 protein [Cyanobacteria bacterium SID2]|nr:glycosyltransferase family 4 protein [Cyanobacteria bacterium SID2]
MSSIEDLNIAFVGNDWFRKGGIVILRVAQIAKRIGLPIEIHLVSHQSHGYWSTHPNKKRSASDLKLLELDNVKFYGGIPNPQVIDLLEKVDFQVLASLADHSAYSILEGFSVGTPAIATNVGAIPEYNLNGKAGKKTEYLLDLPLAPNRQWKEIDYPNKNSDEYWQMLDSVYTKLAQKVIEILGNFWENSNRRERYKQLSSGAISQVKKHHDSDKIDRQLDTLYSSCLCP